MYKWCKFYWVDTLSLQAALLVVIDEMVELLLPQDVTWYS